MRVNATIRTVEGLVVADCQEYAAQGEGKTVAAAIVALREALADRVNRPEAVGPPPRAEDTNIEIVIVADKDETGPHGPDGPGEVP